MGEIEQLRIFYFGDSVAGQKPQEITKALTRAYGDIGVGYTGVYTTNITTGDIVYPTTDFDYWPTGTNYDIGVGAELAFGRGGSFCGADIINLYYIKHPGAGTFKIQMSEEGGGGYVDEAGYTNVDADNPTIDLGIISIPKTYGKFIIKAIGLTGRVKIIGPYFKNTTHAGIEVINFALGGLSLADANTSSQTVLTAFLKNFDPDLAFFEMKESPSIMLAGLPVHQSRFDIGSPNLDWIYVASTPTNGANNDEDQILQNNYVRAHAVNNGKMFFDAYTPIGGFETMKLAPADGFISGSITRSSGTATMTTISSHGYATNNYVVIQGADQSEYNGGHQIVSTGANTFTFAVSGSPTTPATGNIKVARSWAGDGVHAHQTCNVWLAGLMMREMNLWTNPYSITPFDVVAPKLVSAGQILSLAGPGQKESPSLTFTTDPVFGFDIDLKVKRALSIRDMDGNLGWNFDFSGAGNNHTPTYVKIGPAGPWLRGDGTNICVESAPYNTAAPLTCAFIQAYTGGVIGTGGSNISRIKHSTATLVAGVVTVSDASITSNSRILVNRFDDFGTVGASYSITRSPGVSFTITSKDGSGANQTADTSVVTYTIIEP